MSEWLDGQLADTIAALDAGFSVNAEDRPHGAGEIGVLKTSAVSGGAFLPQQNKTVVEHERRLAKEPVLADSILVSRMNTPALVGESCYVHVEHPLLFLPDRIWQLKPKDRTKVNMRWLSFVLQSAAYRRHIEVHATGTSGSMKNLPKSKLLTLPVNYPALQEQEKIAQVLDTLDNAIHETEAIIAKLKVVKQGLLHDLLMRGIDANGELRPPQSAAPHLYKNSPLGWIPKEWEVWRLVRLGVGGLMNGVFKEPSRVGSGVPLVNVADLYRGESVNLQQCELYAASDVERSKFSAQGGDIFFTRSSLKLEGIAKTSYLSDEVESSVFECHVVRLRPNISRVVPRYLKEWCVSQQARTHFMGNAKQVTMTTISQDGIASLECPVPLLSEQEEVVRRVEALDARLNGESLIASKLRVERRALMDDLLTGRVRVTPLLEPITA